MANGRKAILKILASEGVTKRSLGYVNDPDDSGGETVAGIARNFWPKWLGWEQVDAAKKAANFPKNLVGDQGLFEMIVDFYDKNFWDKIGGDKITNEEIAELIADSAVNEGVVPAVKRAQGIAGVDQTGKATNDLVERINLLA